MDTLLSYEQDLDAYRDGCKFLPVLNNEFHKNATYKKRFSSLENLVLIKVNREFSSVSLPYIYMLEFLSS